MSIETESDYDESYRSLLRFSSKLAEPFCSAWHLLRYRLVAPLDPQKFENCTSVAQEIALRVLIGLGAFFGGLFVCAVPEPFICLGLARMICRGIGFSYQQGGYTHVCGLAPEKALHPQDPQLKVMTWNICGIPGGLSLDHGGVIHWRSRLSGIISKIEREDPDVLVLQEIYDIDLAEELIERLKWDYAHFYTHLGPNTLGMVGGCMVLSKCAVHRFSNTSFDNNSWDLNRGFATLELKASPRDALPCARIIGTHFIHGDTETSRRNRVEQLAQVVNHVAQQHLSMPTILVGDLNTERDQPEGALLAAHLHHGYQGSEPTCTNRLTAQWDLKPRTVWDETIDYISLFKSALPNGELFPAVDTNIIMEDCHLVKAFDQTYNTKTALSDHHGISVAIRGLRQATAWLK